MGDSLHRVFESDPGVLAKMMALDAEDQAFWRPEELGAILRHQLSAPVQFDLGGLHEGLAEKLKTLSSAEGLLVKSFSDLLHHPHPPVELLRITKEFAKANRHHPNSPVPGEIATVLYFASIIVARIRCGARITDLDDDSLRSGLQWVMAQPWLDEESCALFQEGMDALRQGEH